MAHGAHIEWMKLMEGLLVPDRIVTSEFVAVTGTSAAAPADINCVRINAVDGPVHVHIAPSSPDASVTGQQIRIEAYQFKDFYASPGLLVSVEAA
jgi:hypothetical protein